LILEPIEVRRIVAGLTVVGGVHLIALTIDERVGDIESAGEDDVAEII